jgi:hypothetical protein
MAPKIRNRCELTASLQVGHDSWNGNTPSKWWLAIRRPTRELVLLKPWHRYDNVFRHDMIDPTFGLFPTIWRRTASIPDSYIEIILHSHHCRLPFGARQEWYSLRTTTLVASILYMLDRAPLRLSKRGRSRGSTYSMVLMTSGDACSPSSLPSILSEQCAIIHSDAHTRL